MLADGPFVLDLSVDHKPESESEQARIQQHYDSIHGANSFHLRSSVMMDLVVRARSRVCVSVCNSIDPVRGRKAYGSKLVERSVKS